MRAHWQYLKYVIRHKWFVFLACRKLGVGLWQALTHDWSKFLPSEWFSYARRFYGQRTQEADAAYEVGWYHHQRRQPHHWEYWVFFQDSSHGDRWGVQAHQPELGPWILARNNQPLGVFDDETMTGKHDVMNPLSSVVIEEIKNRLNQSQPKALPMPGRYTREMVADWWGASRARDADLKVWYHANKHKMILHPDTRERVEALLREV